MAMKNSSSSLLRRLAQAQSCILVQPNLSSTFVSIRIQVVAWIIVEELEETKKKKKAVDLELCHFSFNQTKKKEKKGTMKNLGSSRHQDPTLDTNSWCQWP
jgi:hypothetical protein